jgi:hypothetical protein
VLRRQDFNLEFIGIGAARCGTSWIARCLQEHPDIFVPARKELHYFNDDAKYDPSLSRMKPFFEEADPDAIWGEFTPRYIINDKALERIRAAFPEAKILVMLRDPVERAFSQWCYFRFNKKKESASDFRAALDGYFHEDYVVKSLYGAQLERVFELFGRDRVWVALFDSIREDPAGLVGRLYSFLGVDADFMPPTADRVVNPSSRKSASPPYVWTRMIRWLTYSRMPGIGALQRRLMPRVARLNRWMDAQEETGCDAVPRLLSGEERGTVYSLYFRKDLERAEELLRMDLSRWKHPRPRRA